MSATVHFERPSFEQIIAVIRRIFPVERGPEFGLTPESIDRYLTHGGIELLWHRIPGWESFEDGSREILDEEFVRLLFSPKQPSSDERVIVVTHECFFTSEQRGFSFRFGDLLPFAREVYPRLVSRPMDFFQAADTVFIAEQSGLLTMLHHEGVRTQFTR